MSQIRISTLSLYYGSPYESMDYVMRMIDRAGESGSDLIVLPELRFVAGDSVIEELAASAARHSAYLVAGLRDTNSNGETESSALLFDRSGGIAGRYLQTHRMPEERLMVGDDLPVFDSDLGPLAMTVGSDSLFLEVYGVLARKGARIVTWSGYPERVRDFWCHDVQWRVRAMDHDVTIVTAMYADDLPFFPQGLESGVPGSPWGRSQVVSRGGVVVADTGYDEGVAVGVVDPDKKKRPVVDARIDQGLPPYGRVGAPLWYLNYFGSRAEFSLLSETPAAPPPRPTGERRVRVCVQSVMAREIWRGGEVPEALIQGIEDAGVHEPDLIVCSEHVAPENDPTVAQTVKRIGRLAADMGSYIVVGGIRSASGTSTAYVWDSRGEIIARIPINWTGSGESLRVVECDFARVGVRTCGDVERPEIDRIFALQGAEIVVDPSQMWAPGGTNLETIARARAMENGLYILCSHFTRSDPTLRSYVVDPYGMVLAATRYGENDMAVAELSLGKERPRYPGDPEGSRYTETDHYMECYTAQSLPEARPDYWATLFSQRRPELYGELCREEDET